MSIAIAAARRCDSRDVPVGALVTFPNSREIFLAGNTRELSKDVTGHAEINALRAAAQESARWKLIGATLVTTLEPCPMCAHAIAEAGITKVIFGAYDARIGAAGTVLDLLRGAPSGQEIEVIGGVRQDECSSLVRRFFSNLRSTANC